MLPILNQSFWRDEAFSVLLSLKSPLEIISLTIKDTNPPLYYLLLHFWMILFGTTEAAVRGMSFSFHLGIFLFSFLLAKRLLRSTVAAILTSLAVLLNPFLLQYAFEARAYSLLVLLTVIFLWLFVRKNYFVAGFALGLGILTHNFGILNLAAAGFWWLYENKQKVFNEKLKESLLFFAMPVLTVMLWGSVIWNQWAKMAGGFWIKQSTTSIWLLSLQKYTSGDLSFSLQSNLYLVSFIIIFFALSFWIWKEAEKDDEANGGLFFSMIFIPTAITYAVSAIFVPVYQERYLISALPAAIVLIGYSLWKLYQLNLRVRNVLVALAAIYLALIVLSAEQIVGTSTKAPINYAVSQILRRAQAGDVIVAKSPLNFLESKFYVKSQGSILPVYTLSNDGKVPFYIGGILFSPEEILKKVPKGVRTWQIDSDASVKLITTSR